MATPKYLREWREKNKKKYRRINLASYYRNKEKILKRKREYEKEKADHIRKVKHEWWIKKKIKDAKIFLSKRKYKRKLKETGKIPETKIAEKLHGLAAIELSMIKQIPR